MTKKEATIMITWAIMLDKLQTLGNDCSTEAGKNEELDNQSPQERE